MSSMSHLLLEVYCDLSDKGSVPEYCLYGPGHPGSHCFGEQCKYMSCTLCPNELAYGGPTGLVEHFEHCAGFGGSMCPEDADEETERFLIEKWKEICVKKIDEALREFHQKYGEGKKSGGTGEKRNISEE